jgi:CheY-like chemotaxis protein
VDLATSAASALARARHGPDLIIVDLGMPDPGEGTGENAQEGAEADAWCAIMG